MWKTLGEFITPWRGSEGPSFGQNPTVPRGQYSGLCPRRVWPTRTRLCPQAPGRSPDRNVLLSGCRHSQKRNRVSDSTPNTNLLQPKGRVFSHPFLLLDLGLMASHKHHLHWGLSVREWPYRFWVTAQLKPWTLSNTCKSLPSARLHLESSVLQDISTCMKKNTSESLNLKKEKQSILQDKHHCFPPITASVVPSQREGGDAFSFSEGAAGLLKGSVTAVKQNMFSPCSESQSLTQGKTAAMKCRKLPAVSMKNDSSDIRCKHSLQLMYIGNHSLHNDLASVTEASSVKTPQA